MHQSLIWVHNLALLFLLLWTCFHTLSVSTETSHPTTKCMMPTIYSWGWQCSCALLLLSQSLLEVHMRGLSNLAMQQLKPRQLRRKWRKLPTACKSRHIQEKYVMIKEINMPLWQMLIKALNTETEMYKHRIGRLTQKERSHFSIKYESLIDLVSWHPDRLTEVDEQSFEDRISAAFKDLIAYIKKSASNYRLYTYMEDISTPADGGGSKFCHIILELYCYVCGRNGSSSQHTSQVWMHIGGRNVMTIHQDYIMVWTLA